MKKNVKIRNSEGGVETRAQESQAIRAAFVPGTFDAEKLTVDVVIATDSDVIRRTWDGPIIEILDCSKKAVRTNRLDAGISVLNNHRTYGDVAEVVVGVVDNYRFEAGKIVGTVRFSKREDIAAMVQDVADGIIRHVSVGYDVHEYTITEKEGETPIYRATDWTPMEVSFVPVPADTASTVRSENSEINLNSESNIMPENTQTRAAEPTPVPAAPAAAPVAVVDEVAQRAAFAAQEQTRSAEITAAVRAAGMDDATALNFITRGVTIDQARAEILNNMAAAQAANATRSAAAVTDNGQRSAQRAEAMENAISHRADSNVQLTDNGRDFRGMSLMRMAEEALTSEGVNTRGMSQREIAQTALGIGTRSVGMQSTSDFPIILGNAVDRKLRAEYALAPSLWRPFATQSDAVDFREKTTVRTDQMVGEFEKVLEGGEYKYDHGTESGEKWKVEKYGKIIAITWEALMNDDLGIFNKIPTAIARKAKKKQDDIVWNIITKNEKLSSDNKALFHADHKNLASVGTALSVDSLQAARLAFRTQKNKSGETLNLTPKFLVVGPENELAAYQLTSTAFTPVTAGTMNPVYNTQLTVIVESRITGKEWYLVGDPSYVDTIEYGFLQGEGELFTERRIGFDVDGLEIKARMVFGAAPIDAIGFYKNPGA